MRRHATSLVVLATAVVLAGCADNTSESAKRSTTGASSGVSDSEAQRYVFARLHDRYGAAHRLVAYQDFSDVLPNTQFKAPGEPAETYSELVVRGRIADVAPGFAFVVDSDDDPSGTRADFDTKGAAWKTVHITVAVTESLAGGKVPGDQVTVGYSIDADTDFELVKQGLVSLDEVVLPLYKSPAFSYDPALYGIVADGGLLAVTGSGGLRFPALSPPEEAQMLGNGALDTVPEVRTAGDQPMETVPAEVAGDSLVPTS